jgi:hypothetical protein
MNQPAEHDRRHAYYKDVTDVLIASGIPFLVGGAFAFAAWTGIVRDTKDFDVFVHPRDFERLMAMLEDAGFRTQVTFTHWLGKALGPGGEVIDFIFSSGNGTCPVDDAWFDHAGDAVVLEREVRIVAPEEMIWQKAFILERDRCDVADVAHLIQRCGDRLDWDRLLARFGEHTDVLLAQIVLFVYALPAHRDVIPPTVMKRLQQGFRKGPSGDRLSVCRGALFSYSQYEDDLQRGYADARVRPFGHMTPEQVDRWRDAFKKPKTKRDLPAENPVSGHRARAPRRPTRRA